MEHVLPRDTQEWTTEDVGAWLASNGLREEVVKAFKEAEIDSMGLPQLVTLEGKAEEELKKLAPVAGHWLKLVGLILSLRSAGKGKAKVVRRRDEEDEEVS